MKWEVDLVTESLRQYQLEEGGEVHYTWFRRSLDGGGEAEVVCFNSRQAAERWIADHPELTLGKAEVVEFDDEAQPTMAGFDLADWKRRLSLARTQDDFTALAFEIPHEPERHVPLDPAYRD